MNKKTSNQDLMTCKTCGKTKDKHVNGRWCYETPKDFPASSADWAEFELDWSSIKPTKHTEQEIVDFGDSINWIINSLLNELDRVHTKNEQYFGECSTLGVDRMNTLNRIKKMLEDFKEDEWERTKKYQESGEGDINE